jgi:hypothetical protein
LVYILEEPEAFNWVDVALVDAGEAVLVEFLVDDCVGFGSALDLPSQDLIFWKFIIGEVGDEGLRPGRYLSDGEGTFHRLLRSPRAWS